MRWLSGSGGMMNKWAILAIGICLGGGGAALSRQGEGTLAWHPLGDRLLKPVSPARMSPSEKRNYSEAIRSAAGMVNSPEARTLAAELGLDILNLTWEDSGRYKGSAVGPNISDMTIQVAEPEEGGNSRATCMPVIRKPNFSDVTTDIDPRDFTLLVGNEHGSHLKRISLYDLLQDPLAHLSRPDSWRSPIRTLLAPRDHRVLVSAQACMLPVPRSSKATFNPVLFNYESVSGDPAVLTVLATREGTSITVIDNKRDGFAGGPAWGQRLFFNRNGMRASLTGERLSDFEDRTGVGRGPEDTAGLNMALLIQIPLKQHHALMPQSGASSDAVGAAKYAAPMDKQRNLSAGIESAVLGHGDDEGPFTEIDNLNIQRDPNFPVRVTVQFYKATSSGDIGREDMEQIAADIDRVYSHGDVVGSLVVSGETGRHTEYAGLKVQPAGWWSAFWQRYEENTGISPEGARANLRRLLGDQYESRPVTELYIRDLLRAHQRR